MGDLERGVARIYYAKAQPADFCAVLRGVEEIYSALPLLAEEGRRELRSEGLRALLAQVPACCAGLGDAWRVVDEPAAAASGGAGGAARAAQTPL